MAKVKTAISLPSQLFDVAEEVAGKMGVSRSRLYAIALESFLEKRENEELILRINNAYADETDAEERAARAAMKTQQRRLLKDEW